MLHSESDTGKGSGPQGGSSVEDCCQIVSHPAVRLQSNLIQIKFLFVSDFQCRLSTKPICVFGAVHTEIHLSESNVKRLPKGRLN